MATNWQQSQADTLESSVHVIWFYDPSKWE